MERQVSIELSGPQGGRVEVCESEKSVVFAGVRDCIRIRKEDIPKLRDWLNKLERHDEVSVEQKRREDDEQGERVQ